MSSLSYFDEHNDGDDDEEDFNRSSTRAGRVNVVNPRTPGGRIARSMDIDRNFMFNAGAIERASGARTPTGA